MSPEPEVVKPEIKSSATAVQLKLFSEGIVEVNTTSVEFSPEQIDWVNSVLVISGISFNINVNSSLLESSQSPSTVILIV